jgi:MFS family permease
MVLEMVLLSVAPRNGGIVLLLCCLANRVLSGMAEGMASGADEALVFDSLAERGRSAEWPKVLDHVMRWQGLGMVIAMLVGGAVYDPVFMSRVVSWFGATTTLTQGTTLRFPVYLNLITALAALTAWHLVVNAGAWIVRTPVALFVITAGVLIDSVTRLFLTFSSSYFRIIELPEASFGIIGATFGGLGFFVSPLARRMVLTNTVARNYALIAGIVLAGLIGVACRWNYFGVIFMVPLAGAMMALGYMVSYYLNALVDSSHRATVLSFKGVAFNLGYGFISLVFALVLRAVRDGGSTQEAVSRGLIFLPLWLLGGGLLGVICFWRKRGLLSSPI